MITNGTIQVVVPKPREYNQLGELIRQEEPVWSDPIDCNIKLNNRPSLGRYIDGEFTNVTYEIFLDHTESVIGASRVKLTRQGIDLGEFPVYDILPLPLVGRIKFMV